VAKWQKKNNQPLWPVAAASNKKTAAACWKNKRKINLCSLSRSQAQKTKRTINLCAMSRPQARNKIGGLLGGESLQLKRKKSICRATSLSDCTHDNMSNDDDGDDDNGDDKDNNKQQPR